MRSLPLERLEVPVWKQTPVHAGDGFCSLGDKRFAVPGFRGKTVWLRYTPRSGLLRIFHDLCLIREYVVGSKRLYYLPGDFPEVQEQIMQGSYPQYLLKKAQAYGPDAYALIEAVLRPHAYLNARRAQGMLEVIKEFQRAPFFGSLCRQALRRGVKLPSSLRAMLKEEQRQFHLELLPELSEAGKQMIRDIQYYIN